MAVDHWRPYLLHDEFIIYTNQHSLSHLTEQKLNTPWQQKVFTKLLGLQYKILYKKGIENGAADALSHRPHESSELYHISSSSPQWLSEIMDGYQQDHHAQQLLSELVVTASPAGHYKLQNGVIKYKGRFWLGANSNLQRKVISAFHDSPMGGHSGFLVTYRRIHQLFAWPYMKQQVKDYVAACSICQQSKPDRSKYPGSLQPLPVLEQAWQVVSMDFIEGLPRSVHANSILVVVDKFSRYAHFIPLLHPYTAFKVAQLFMSSVYKLHDMPEAIISDRDRIFTSSLWQELFKLAGTQLRIGSAYHPQSDDQTERVNQCLETYLRCFIHACPHKWNLWLSLAEFWYNTSFHSALGRSPFEVLYGRPPRHFGLATEDSVTDVDLATWLSNRELMTKVVRQHLHSAQSRMKSQEDKA
jgi:hypothetical protein